MAKKREYYVEAPLTGKVTALVDARSEEEAIRLLVNAAWTVREPESDDVRVGNLDFMELELHEQVCEGNILYGPLGRASAEET